VITLLKTSTISISSFTSWFGTKFHIAARTSKIFYIHKYRTFSTSF